MKRIYVLIFAINIFLYQSGKAQKGVYVGFSGNLGLSVVANPNLYNVKWTGLGNFDPSRKLTAGYGGALKIGYNFSPPLGFLVEGGYQKRGEQFEDIDSKGTTHTREIDLNYLTTGVYFRYTSILKRNYYKQKQKIRLAVVVGPQINILIAADQKYGLEGDLILPFNLNDIPYPSNQPPFWTSEYNFTNKMNDKLLFNRVDIGLVARVGLDFYPKDWFFISPMISSYFSFTDINNENYAKHSGYASSRNLSLGFDIGFGFYIASKKEK